MGTFLCGCDEGSIVVLWGSRVSGVVLYTEFNYYFNYCFCFYFLFFKLEVNFSDKIDIEQVATFIDMFYLPFEHGRRGLQMLKEFSWLHENSYVVRKKPSHPDSATEDEVSA